MPLYVLGLMGVTRRMSHFEDPSLQIWFQIAALGVALIGVGVFAMIVQFYVSFKRRHALRDVTGDPWGGRTLEWATSSPPPDYNFAFTPRVYESDTWADMKKNGYTRPLEGFTAIHMPKNTAAGFVIAALSAFVGFALVWQMWLVAGLGFAATMAAIIIHTFNYKRDFYIPADEVVRTENARTRLLESHV
jgi:cytochrome o ubiquinol oxidase subunit 1